MYISGLQKMTLLDYPGFVACTVFTAGCNFRCPFCHNASLALPERRAERIPTDEVLAFLGKRAGLLDGMVLSGGEPLLQEDAEDFLKEVRSLGYRIKLDTNGSFPEKLEALAEQGLLDYVAMDSKAAPALYGQAAGLHGADFDAVGRSIRFLLKGSVPYEFRTTVVRGLHTEENLLELADYIRGADAYYLQQYRDSGDILRPEGLSAFSDDEMRALEERLKPVIPGVRLRGVDETIG